MYHIARKYNVEIGRDRSYVWLWGLCAVPQWHNKTRLLWLKCVKFLYINQNSALHLTGFYYKNKPKKKQHENKFLTVRSVLPDQWANEAIQWPQVSVQSHYTQHQ